LIDKLAYFVKKYCTPIYDVMERVVGHSVYYCNRRKIDFAVNRAEVIGSVDGKVAHIRPLEMRDHSELVVFFERISSEHLTFFHPHSFSSIGLARVLAKPYYLLYGLFVENAVVGYCVLKLFPGRKTFRGRLVSEDWGGRGVGRFLSKYLNWQVGLLGFSSRSTISRKNLASLKSHEIEGHFSVISELPNDFILIEFHRIDHPEPPNLLLRGSVCLPIHQGSPD